MNHSLDELLFMAARSYGSDMTTAGLRFHAPLEEIPKGSTVAVVGKGMAGRYWYAQLILSDLCENVYWVSSREDLPEGICPDRILIAK